MGAHHPNGSTRGRDASDEPRPNWRPQDQSHGDYRGRGNDPGDREHDIIHDERWRDRDERDEPRQGSRDPRRWEGSRGSELGSRDDRNSSTEWYGQGQSGYSAGRYGDDRAQAHHMRNRNDPGSPNASSRRDFEDDDRFTGRGWSASQDRSEPWRDERGIGSSRRVEQGQHMGYQSGHRDPSSEEPGYGRGYGGYGTRGSQDSQGYLGSQHRSQDGRGGQAGGQDFGRGQAGTDVGRRGQAGSEDLGRRGQGGGEDFGPRGQARGWQDMSRPGHQHQGTGPHRGKGPMGYQRSDERIRELVCEALADDDQIDASQIHVAVKDGEVTLTGTVDDRHTKREAEDCVASINGVRDVQIQLRIRDDRQSTSASATPTNPAKMASPPAGNGATGSTTGKPEGDADKKHRA